MTLGSTLSEITVISSGELTDEAICGQRHWGAGPSVLQGLHIAQDSCLACETHPGWESESCQEICLNEMEMSPHSQPRRCLQKS